MVAVPLKSALKFVTAIPYFTNFQFKSYPNLAFVYLIGTSCKLAPAERCPNHPGGKLKISALNRSIIAPPKINIIPELHLVIISIDPSFSSNFHLKQILYPK